MKHHNVHMMKLTISTIIAKTLRPSATVIKFIESLKSLYYTVAIHLRVTDIKWDHLV